MASRKIEQVKIELSAQDSLEHQVHDLADEIHQDTKEIHHLAHIGKFAVCFGALTVLSAIVTTSVILTTRSSHVDSSDHGLKDSSGKVVKVDTMLETDSILSAHSGSFDKLSGLKEVGFTYLVPGAESPSLIVFGVAKAVRHQDTTRIYGSGDVSVLIVGIEGANYTDGEECTKEIPCSVFLSPHGPMDEKTGRRLWSWNKPTSWFSPPPPPPPAAANWKATSSCPWACKQGWWWQSNAYAKPACCTETKNSPYDNCNYDKCSCDAACSSCCD